MYTGHGVRGAVALLAAGGAVAAGYFNEQQDVNCRIVVVNNACPAEDVLSRKTRRPYLATGVAAAAGVTLLSAIDGLLAARRANGEAASSTGSSGGGSREAHLAGPALVADGTAVRIDILRVRFR